MDPLRWRVAVAVWPSRYRIVDDGQGDRTLLVVDMEEWLWANLPRWLASFIASTHDTLPWTKGVWSDDEYGDVR